MAVAVVAQAFPTCSCSASYCRRNETVSSSLPLPRAIFPFSAVSFSLARKLASPSKCNGSVQRKGESILLCTNAESVDVVELSGLLAATRQNCEQFPKVLDDGSVVPVDPVKLRRALRHSTVVVALYVETRERRVPERLDGGGWRDYWMPQVQVRRTLIAFGRATSDHTLTASIYDLVLLDGLDYAAATCIISAWSRHFSSTVFTERKCPRFHHLIKDPGMGVEFY